jgi:hypothetical protein
MKTKKAYKVEQPADYVVREGSAEYRSSLSIGFTRTCNCKKTNINCMTPKEWLKSQLGVWQFVYEARDIRDKNAHPATFPISLCKKVIELFTHQGELVLDPFVGSGTTSFNFNCNPSPTSVSSGHALLMRARTAFRLARSLN